jgi:hypothetical protein
MDDEGLLGPHGAFVSQRSATKTQHRNMTSVESFFFFFFFGTSTLPSTCKFVCFFQVCCWFVVANTFVPYRGHFMLGVSIVSID